MTATTCTRILPIPPDAWPPPEVPLTVHGIPLAPKQELHITLVGSALGEELQRSFGDRAAGLLDAEIQAREWRWERTGAHVLLRRRGGSGSEAETAYSVIERVRLPAMAGREKGIGVRSPRHLRALRVPGRFHVPAPGST